MINNYADTETHDLRANESIHFYFLTNITLNLYSINFDYLRPNFRSKIIYYENYGPYKCVYLFRVNSANKIDYFVAKL